MSLLVSWDVYLLPKSVGKFDIALDLRSRAISKIFHAVRSAYKSQGTYFNITFHFAKYIQILTPQTNTDSQCQQY